MVGRYWTAVRTMCLVIAVLGVTGAATGRLGAAEPEPSAPISPAALSLLVDDFADSHPGNRLSLWSGTYAAPTGATISMGLDGKALTLTWVITSPGAYAGYVSEIKGTSSTDFNAISLQVRGAKGGERVRIGVRDSLGNESKVPIGEFLPNGITTSFQQAVIPIAMFTSLGRVVGFETVSLTFENQGASSQGSITIDDVRLEFRPDLDMPVESFDEQSTENAFSGGYWLTMDGGSVLTMAPLRADRGNVLRLNLSGSSPKGWAMWVTDLRTANVSSMKAVSFWIRAFGQATRPNLYLVTRPGGTEVRKYVDIEKYGAVGSTWKRIVVPLKAFSDQGIDLSQVAELRVVIEGETADGLLDIDDIRFQATYTFETVLPVAWR